MADRDLRTWMSQIEAEGELKRIKARVDWDDEISQIIRKVYHQQGPALLFENIKDHENTFCRRLFTNALSTQARMNLMLGLAKDTPHAGMIQTIKSRLKKPLPAVRVKTGPCKENVIKGKDVDLFQIPVPKWHPLDGGRYINTFYGAVTRDPETGANNVGIYRGEILGKNKIGSLLIPMKDWGILFDKYKEMGKNMPVAFIYGFDPTLLCTAGSPVNGIEYDLAGAMRQQAMEIVKCETSDIEVPAGAEIVLEGEVLTDPATYEVEGPFGEGSGHYGEARERPVAVINCITHRQDPIFRGTLMGTPGGVQDELKTAVGAMMAAIMWNTLEVQEIPGILDIRVGPISAIKIHKTYQGQPRQIAAALWGSKFAGHHFNAIIVTEDDVDIHNSMALWAAMHDKVNFKRGLVVYPLYMGSPIDVSAPYELRDELEYGACVQDKLLIDATIDWELHPKRKEWGGSRYAPRCHFSRPETEELVDKRWKEYGI